MATSARPFPVPSTSHLLSGPSPQAWMATKGQLSMYGVNRRGPGESMFVVGGHAHGGNAPNGGPSRAHLSFI